MTRGREEEVKTFFEFSSPSLATPGVRGTYPPDQTPGRGRKTYLIKTLPRKMCRRTCAFVHRPNLRVYPSVREAVTSPGSETIGSQSPLVVGVAKRRRFSYVLKEKSKIIPSIRAIIRITTMRTATVNACSFNGKSNPDHLFSTTDNADVRCVNFKTLVA